MRNRMRHRHSVAVAAIAATLALGAACSKKQPAEAKPPSENVDPDLGVLALPAPSDPKAARLLDKAYALKQDGHNGAALAAIDEACALIEKTAGPASAEYGSCLDDRASVHLRTGRAEEAKREYESALAILRKAKGADPRLVHGVMTRLEELELMEQKGITCAEPAEPTPADAGVTLPYFPDVGEMQNAIGTLNPYVAVCSEGAPEAVTVRIIITGDGLAVRAETRGLHAGTPLGECVLAKLLEAFPKVREKLPKFRACYRGFTYPFMVGRHESRQPK